MMTKGSGTVRALLRLAGLVAIAVLAYLAWQHYTGSVEYPEWDQVHFGHSREAVLELLGDPAEETVEFRLGPRKGHEQIYADAEKSGAQVWLVYHGGLDLTYAIGLDKDDRVVFKARGGP